MYISATLIKLLAKNYVKHKVYEHPRMDSLYKAALWHGIDAAKVIDCQVLTTKRQKLLVVYPLTRVVNVQKINTKLHKNFEPLEEHLSNKIFKDCESGIKLPFGQSYDLDVLIDKSIELSDKVYFNGGSYTALVEMSLADFLFLNAGAMRLDCTDKVEAITEKNLNAHQLQFADYNLPEVPAIIRKVLALATEKETNIHELAQILSHEQEALTEIFGSLEVDALNAESGQANLLKKFSNLSHVVIGVSTAKALVANDLPINELKDFWVHAFMAASLAEDLTKHAHKVDLDPRISYLAGILHNLGFILLCKLFPPEFKLLQKWQQFNPDIPIRVLEKKMLGMGKAFEAVHSGHAKLGEWLLRSWHVPEEICVIARHHHNPNYTEQYAEYVKIMQITNHLLKCHGIGDGSLTPIPMATLDELGLTQEILDECLEKVLSLSPEMEKLTKAITK